MCTHVLIKVRLMEMISMGSGCVRGVSAWPTARCGQKRVAFFLTACESFCTSEKTGWKMKIGGGCFDQTTFQTIHKMLQWLCLFST